MSPLSLNAVLWTTTYLISTTNAQATPPLRLMPLGASITWGSKSTHGNGYRAHLHELLTEAGLTIDMVGSRQGGSMKDNDVEGWPGARIDQVHRHAQESVPKLLPDVITLNAGSNDCMQDYKINGAGSRMNGLIEDLWYMAPNAIIILSTVTFNNDTTVEECVQRLNKQLKGLVGTKQREAKRIILADMHGKTGISHKDLADHVHPNDRGYMKMAHIWFEAIQNAEEEGFLNERRFHRVRSNKP